MRCVCDYQKKYFPLACISLLGPFLARKPLVVPPTTGCKRASRAVHTERGMARGTPRQSIMYNFNVAVHTKAARQWINRSGTAEVSGGRFGKSLWKRFFQRAKRHLQLLTNQVPEIWWRIWLRPQETSELVIDFVRDFVYGKLCAKSIFSRQGHLDFLEVGQFTSGAQPKPLFIVK